LTLIRGKGTVDMTKDFCRSPSQCLKMLLDIPEQQLECAAVMIMGHDSSRDVAQAVRFTQRLKDMVESSYGLRGCEAEMQQ
jgi:hypothetical protein